MGKETRQNLLPIAYDLKKATNPDMQNRIRSKLINPGGLIVVTYKKSEDSHRQQEDYAATCCAIQNLMLAAYGESLGSKWSTGGLTQHPRVCNLLGIDLTNEIVAGFIWLGTPAKVPNISRPSVSEHIAEHP